MLISEQRPTRKGKLSMAEKAKKDGDKKAPKTRKVIRDKPGAGHNVASLRADGVDIIEAYLDKVAAMESDMAGYRSEFADLYAKAAETLGLKKSVVQAELKRILGAKKQAEKEEEMAPDEREQTELWRSAMEGTPFGDYAAGQLADPKSE
jgi:anti-sigma-K factor RskA